MHLIRKTIIFAFSIGLIGCAAPQANGPSGRRVSGGILLLENPVEKQDLRYADWLPGTGRMGSYARKRHLPPQAAWKAVFVDEFENSTASQVAGWRIVGKPTIKTVRLDQANAVELETPQGEIHPCGIERDLDSVPLAGKDIRLDIRFTCRSPRRAKALEGVSLSFETTDSDGREYRLPLLVHAQVTPGWEIQRYWLRFKPTIGPVSLVINMNQPGSIFTLDRIALYTREILQTPFAKNTPSTTHQPSIRAVNLIRGGDFETGQKSFYTSAANYWANGEEMVIPLRWEFDHGAAVGNNSIRLHIADETGRITFGPLDLNQRSVPLSGNFCPWYLSFYARADRPTTLMVTLRHRNRALDRANFRITDQWRRYTKIFSVDAHGFDERTELATSELLFDIVGDGLPGVNYFQLDAVALTDVAMETPYHRPSPIEVGLFGPIPDSTDISNILDEKDPVSVGVRLVSDRQEKIEFAATASEADIATNDTEQTSPEIQSASVSAGKLAIDILDAWDRVIWTRTTTPAIPESGILDETVLLELPRGYYRVLATLWSAEPAQSTILSQADTALAVISEYDPVPLSNMFGLSAEDANISIRTTQLGAGWVRTDLIANKMQIRPGLYDFSFWNLLLERCRHADVEIVANLTLPRTALLWKLFLEQLFKTEDSLPIAAAIRPPIIAVEPLQEYVEQLTWLRNLLNRRSPEIKLIRYLSAWQNDENSIAKEHQIIADAAGFILLHNFIPETDEQTLASIDQLTQEGEQLWDLGVPVDFGPNSSRIFHSMPNNLITQTGPMLRFDEPVDPVRSASQMVRSLLIRTLAGTRMVCSEAIALSPIRSIYEDKSRCLHEKDLSPRVALVAFDLMTSLLNTAVPVLWVDFHNQSRILYFEKDDGGAVAAVWRPYGLAPTRLEFANLPAEVKVLDCTGRPEPIVTESGKRIVEVNEIIRYIIAQPKNRKQLRRAIETAGIITAAATQPAAG